MRSYLEHMTGHNPRNSEQPRTTLNNLQQSRMTQITSEQHSTTHNNPEQPRTMQAYLVLYILIIII